MAVNIFISSPVDSLEKERQAVYESLEKIGFRNIFLSEVERSRSLDSRSVCMREIESSNLFILILGKFYGWIPENEDYSVTELEYNKAVEEKLEILVFKLDFFEYEEKQSLFIRRVEDFENGKFRGKSISKIEELKDKVFYDIPQHFVEKSEATKKVPVKEISKSETLINFSESKELTINQIDINNPPLLLIKARINYDDEAGNGYLVRFYFNNYEFRECDLLNKPKKYILADKREFPWFHSNLNCWSLPYSQNFKENYTHHKYKIVNGDAYTFIFSLENVKLHREKNILRITHSGNESIEAHKNPIIAHYEIIK